jgi:hypothetical protein
MGFGEGWGKALDQLVAYAKTIPNTHGRWLKSPACHEAGRPLCQRPFFNARNSWKRPARLAKWSNAPAVKNA